MKVILLKDVKKVGKANEIVEVSDGYARNFLFRRNLAVPVTEQSLDILKQQEQDAATQQAKIKAEAEATKVKMETIELTFKLNVGENQKVFGSVSTKQISDALLKQHDIKVDKRKIKSDPLVELGVYHVDVELHKAVHAKLNVQIKAQE